jgi:hypothetical protein
VKGDCYQFINIYDSRSYIAGVKGLGAQGMYFMLGKRGEQPRTVVPKVLCRSQRIDEHIAVMATWKFAYFLIKGIMFC